MLISRNNANNFASVYDRIKAIATYLKSNNITEIVLADDVIFSGNVAKTIISEFAKYQIKVIGIRAGIATIASFTNFANLPLGIKCGFILGDKVIDQICERDFYFGIAGSGISVLQENKIYKSPYFIPFGNPIERASIPPNTATTFSKSCLTRSIALWCELERLNSKTYKISDLPEKIIGTDNNEEVIKTLKKELKK